ncbi:MAG: hypothetical protein GY953_37610, partial [bacterium]|nr:hypothetical protein [bacterium]
MAVGARADDLDAAQLRLLGLPLHLALYADVVAAGDPFLNFSTPNQLFREYVRRKRDAVDARRTESEWVSVVDGLLGAMSREEQLSVPWAAVFRWEPYARAMASEHVLVEDAGRVAFFHEALFDYLFGLRFDAGTAIADWLRRDEQGLFRRAQVRQLLAFRQHEHEQKYLADLRELLLGDGVRFHIRRLVVAWLGNLTAPTSAEAAVLLEFVMGPDRAEAQHALQTTRGSRAWFQHLKAHVDHFLDDFDEGLRNQTLWWLMPMAPVLPDEVAGLLAARLDRPEWVPRLAWFVSSCRGFAQGEGFVTLVVQLVESGALDAQAGATDLWPNLGHKDAEPPYQGI